MWTVPGTKDQWASEFRVETAQWPGDGVGVCDVAANAELSREDKPSLPPGGCGAAKFTRDPVLLPGGQVTRRKVHRATGRGRGWLHFLGFLKVSPISLSLGMIYAAFLCVK